MSTEEKRIYTIATAHLDTSWLWRLEKTIAEYIPHTLESNFRLFEKYPDYVFNFEGSYRYALAEEYYPQAFERLKEYVAQGRWNPCGSCYENGDVNIPSPEALLRNILYGNGYFEEKFGLVCNDIFLPDCFGFGRALPSIAAHAGLKGFSTGKLAWGSASDLPFDVGRWQGIDGNSIYACLHPYSYTSTLKKIRDNPDFRGKLKRNLTQYRLPYTFVYHGTGDRGGAPTENSVKNTIRALRDNDKSEVKVLSASTTRFFEDMDMRSEELQAALPVWSDELLLTEHGAGSYTSRTVSKRWNRRAELLADAAERSAVAAFAMGLAAYPQRELDEAWKLVIAHQFHDDITGTSFQTCYQRNWNDYVQAMNRFADIYTASVDAVCARLDTSFAKGIPVVVSNPTQADGRRETVTVRIFNETPYRYVRAFAADGTGTPAQVVERGEDFLTVAFSAVVPANGVTVYDIQPAETPCPLRSPLQVSPRLLKNERYRVRLDDNGDIVSVYDFRLGRELLSAPIRMAVLDDVNSFNWPAWEVKYKDICAPPREYAGAPVTRILEYGPARVAVETIRTAGSSVLRQVLSLDAGGGPLRVENETDWRTTASLLKAVFPTACENTFASYDLGLGVQKRPTNTERLYEVPAQRWAAIADSTADFGVGILSDSRCAWDKPDNHTLRLTCVHTPQANYRWECAQHLLDLGLNRYAFGVCGFNGNGYDTLAATADAFCQPMHTFVTEKHKGSLGASYSFATLHSRGIRISAIKKAQRSDELVVRFFESAGLSHAQAEFSAGGGIEEAREVTGFEKDKAPAVVTDGRLCFSINRFEPKTFILRLKKPRLRPRGTAVPLALPCNAVAVTRNTERGASTLPGGVSVPAELLPETITCGGIVFTTRRDSPCAVRCEGQTLGLPDGTERVSLLACSLDGDRDVTFCADDRACPALVPDAFEAVGAWDLIGLGETGRIKKTPLAFTASHTHTPDGDAIARQFYLFRLTLPVKGAKTLTLPDDSNILLFAAAVSSGHYRFENGDELYDSLEKRPFDYILTDDERRHAAPAGFEKRLDRFINRERAYRIRLPKENTAIQPAEVYYALRMIADKAGHKKRRTKD